MIKVVRMSKKIEKYKYRFDCRNCGANFDSFEDLAPDGNVSNCPNCGHSQTFQDQIPNWEYVKDLEQKHNQLIDGLKKEWQFLEDFITCQGDNIDHEWWTKIFQRQADIQKLLEAENEK
jgi:transcription elongation factor Elf1